MPIIQRYKWVPSVLIMAVIFYFSAQPSSNLPDYGNWDALIKKSGHIIGYCILSISNQYWFDGKKTFPSFLALAYAFSDEFHQSFTIGRFPSIIDILIYDLIGILLGLVLYPWIYNFIQTRVRNLRQ